MIGINQNFIVFENILWGLRAMGTDIRTKINSGYNTINKLIYRYAPPTENNTEAYISLVVQYSGIDRNTVLQATGSTLQRIIRAMMNVELGLSYSHLVTDQEIQQGIEMMSGIVPDSVILAGGGVGLLILGFTGWLLYKNVLK